MHTDFSERRRRAGASILGGEALQPIATAIYLRNTRTANVAVVDNPAPDLKEVLGGYYLIEAADDAHAAGARRALPGAGRLHRGTADLGVPRSDARRDADGGAVAAPPPSALLGSGARRHDAAGARPGHRRGGDRRRVRARARDLARAWRAGLGRGVVAHGGSAPGDRQDPSSVALRPRLAESPPGDRWTSAAGRRRARRPAGPDDDLRLVVLCCHPALAVEAQVALTLRLGCGAPTAAIAGAFLVSEPTMAARLTRAKRRIAGSGTGITCPTTRRRRAAARRTTRRPPRVRPRPHRRGRRGFATTTSPPAPSGWPARCTRLSGRP